MTSRVRIGSKTVAASCPGDRLFDFLVFDDDDPDPDPPPEPDPEAVVDAGRREVDEALASVVVGTTEFMVSVAPLDWLRMPVDSVTGLLGELADEGEPASVPVESCVVVPAGVGFPSTLPLVAVTVIEPPSCVFVIVSMALVGFSMTEDCAVDVGSTCAIVAVVVSAVVVIRLPGAVTMLANSLATLFRGFNGENMSRCWTGIACAAQQVN